MAGGRLGRSWGRKEVGGQERVNEGLITATSLGVLDKVWQC